MRLSTILASIAVSIPRAVACRSSKRGLAWAAELNKGIPFDAFPSDTITAYYTWTEEPVRDAPFPFIPMLWGCDADMAANFSKAVENNFAIDSYTPTLTKDKAILAFSEPALASQSNCSPAQAAQVWMDHIEPLKQKGFRLGTPAVTIGSSGHGWLLEWFVRCNGCNPDFLALHWYGTGFDDLQEKLQGYHDAFKMPIWLTEFAAQNFTNEQHNPDPKALQPSLLEVNSLLNQSMDWLDAQDWVERYFWFGAMYDMQTLNPFDSLFNAFDVHNRTGQLNALGQMYVTAKGVCSSAITRNAARRGPSLAMAILLGVISILCVV